jgi:hypothetical protein
MVTMSFTIFSEDAQEYSAPLHPHEAFLQAEKQE